MTDAELVERINSYHWYHVIRLTDNVSTPGYEQYRDAQNLCMARLRTLDLAGKRVLDVGCRDGLYSFAAEQMGASEVVGIDNDLSEGAVELLIPFFGSKVRMIKLNLYDLRPDSFGLFDVVIFPGVLYHLRYPVWGLRALREVLRPGGHLIIETAVYEGDPHNAILFCPVGDESPYAPDVSSCTFFNPKGLRDTLSSLGFETLHTDLLFEREPEVPSRWELAKSGLRSLIRPRPRPAPPKIGPWNINRAVLHSVHRSCDPTLAKYWESVHDLHSGDSRDREANA